MSELKQQIEKKAVFMYPDKTAYMMNETVQVISVDFVLGLLADYKCIPLKEHDEIIRVLNKTKKNLEKALEQKKNHQTSNVCIPRKQLESARDMSMKADEKLGVESLATHILVKLLDGESLT